MNQPQTQITVNYPEQWGETEAPIQAEFVLGKYRVTSKTEIAVTRGITFNGIVDKIGANNYPNKRAGWFKYYLTVNAFERFCKSNNVQINCLLD